MVESPISKNLASVSSAPITPAFYFTLRFNYSNFIHNFINCSTTNESVNPEVSTDVINNYIKKNEVSPD